MPTTTTTISRSKLTYPDLGHDGGALLHSRSTTLLSTLGDNDVSRIAAYVGVANSSVNEFDHNFGSNLENLWVFIFTGTGITKVRVLDTVAAGYVIDEKPSFEKTIIRITAPSGGGPHTFTVLVIDGHMTPVQIHSLIATAPSTPSASGIFKTWIDSNGRGLNKNSLGSVGTEQTLTPVHVSSATFNALPGFHYICDTTSNAITATLPATIQDFDVIQFSDSKKTFATNNLTLDRNANKVDNTAANYVFSVNGDGGMFVGHATNTNWVKAASGSGSGSSSTTEPNYIDNPSAESATTGWSTYKDAAATTPVDGTGGTALGITLTRNTTTPIRGLADFKIAKAATDAQGEGISAPFTIPVTDVVRKGRIFFRFNASHANYVAGDLAVYVYDVTNSLLKTPSTTAIAKTTGIMEVGFDLTTGVSYRLIYHVTSTNATAWDVYLEDITADTRHILQGPIVMKMGSMAFVPNSGAFGTITDSQFYGSRAGNMLKVMGSFVSGTTAAGRASITLPSGLHVDTTNLSTTHDAKLGTFTRHNGANSFIYDSTIRSGVVFFDKATNDNTLIHFANEKAAGQYKDDIGTNLTGGAPVSGDLFTIEFEIPILEWATEGTVLVASDITRKTKRVTLGLSNFTSIAGVGSLAYGHAIRDSLGNYKLMFEAFITHNASTTDFDFDIDGITTISSVQNLNVFRKDAGTNYAAPASFSLASDNTMRIGTIGFSGTIAAIDGELHLASKPTWFDANVENAQDSTVHFTAGTATAQGLNYAPGSEVRAYNGNGHGSTNTVVRRFSNNVVVGTGITYADSATLGATFTITEDGVYGMGYTDGSSAGVSRHGISLNTTGLPSTQIQSLTALEILAITISPAANQEGNAALCKRLVVGDVIRCHTNSSPNFTDGRCHFFITQIARF